jgi:error-prone DNA polymerase
MASGCSPPARSGPSPPSATWPAARACPWTPSSPWPRRGRWIRWRTTAARPEQLTLALPDRAPQPALAALSEFETISWDWRQSSHSTRGHLLEPLRTDLRAQGWPTAQEVQNLADGARTDYAGIVICRQRPATAKDVTFMTLEDETGFVNLVLWAKVYERFRIEAKTLSFMGVSGKIQSEEGVVHLIVDRIWRPRLKRRPVRSKSRDFH